MEITLQNWFFARSSFCFSIRLNWQDFQDAADLDGKKLSEWIRDRLRRLSREELEDAGRTVAFLSGYFGRKSVD